MPGNFFSCLFLLSADFFKINFFKKLLQEHYKSVKRLDPDQDRHFFSPDLGPNCLQRLSADEQGKS